MESAVTYLAAVLFACTLLGVTAHRGGVAGKAAVLALINAFLSAYLNHASMGGVSEQVALYLLVGAFAFLAFAVGFGIIAAILVIRT